MFNDIPQNVLCIIPYITSTFSFFDYLWPLLIFANAIMLFFAITQVLSKSK